MNNLEIAQENVKGCGEFHNVNDFMASPCEGKLICPTCREKAKAHKKDIKEKYLSCWFGEGEAPTQEDIYYIKEAIKLYEENGIQ